jgi:hypothetical protein
MIHIQRIEVSSAIVMKDSLFGDITPCSALKVNRRFAGTCDLHLHGRRIGQVSSPYHLLSFRCFAWLILRPWIWKRHVLPKSRLNFERTARPCIPEHTILNIPCLTSTEDYRVYGLCLFFWCCRVTRRFVKWTWFHLQVKKYGKDLHI